MKGAYKYKSKIINKVSTPKKYIQGVQSLNTAPDYSNYYNAQDESYNRKAKEKFGSSIVDPVINNFGNSTVNTLGNVASDFIGNTTTDANGIQSKGGAFAEGAVRYGSKATSLGLNPALMAATGGLSAPILGVAGAIGGGTLGLINAQSDNKKIRVGKIIDENQTAYVNSGNINSKYDPRVAMNKEVSRLGYAKRGKYKLKITVKTKSDIPNPNSKKNNRYRDYKRKPKV